VEEIDKPGEVVRSTVLSRGRGFGDGHCRQIGPPRWDQCAAAVGEHDQQQCYAAAVHGAQRLKNAALEGMPLAEDCHRTWEVAEMGSVWWCSLTVSTRIGLLT